MVSATRSDALATTLRTSSASAAAAGAAAGAAAAARSGSGSVTASLAHSNYALGSFLQDGLQMLERAETRFEADERKASKRAVVVDAGGSPEAGDEDERPERLSASTCSSMKVASQKTNNIEYLTADKPPTIINTADMIAFVNTSHMERRNNVSI